jgi:hypothetical protein
MDLDLPQEVGRKGVAEGERGLPRPTGAGLAAAADPLGVAGAAGVACGRLAAAAAAGVGGAAGEGAVAIPQP